MAATKPTFIAFPGAFHPHESLEPLVSKLKEAGYPVQSATLSTVGNSRTGICDDIDRMRGMMIPLCDEGKDVVLVMHSFAGIPGSSAVERLSKTERAAKGLPGGVIGLIYLAAFLSPEGTTLLEASGGWKEWQRVDVCT
jgi:hypothetical protein